MLLFSLCILTVTSFSQSAWQHIGVNEGLAQGYVGSILQDSRGFMWFGTSDGLSRYDGYTFKNYRNDPKDSTTISTGLISALHESKSGFIWVGFNAGNIDCFDRSTEQFIHVREVQNGNQNLSPISFIGEDVSGTLWVMRSNEFLEIKQTLGKNSPTSYHSINVKVHKEFSEPNGSRYLPVLFVDHSGGVWIWSNEEFHVINRTVSALPQFQPGQGRLIITTGGMAEDSEGVIWINVYDSVKNYFYTYNPKTGVTQLVFAQPKTRMFEKWYVLFDQSENIYLVNGEQIIKINRYNISQRSIIRPLSPINIISTMIDKGDILWFGSGGYGLDRYNAAIEHFGTVPGKSFNDLICQTMELMGFPKRRSLSGEQLQYSDLYRYVVFGDRSGKQWYPCVRTKTDMAGAFTDIMCYDSVSRKLLTFPRQKFGQPLSSDKFPISQNVKMIEDNNHICWFFGVNVMSSYEPSRHRFRHYVINAGKLLADSTRIETKNFVITGVLKEHDGTFWLGVYHEGVFNFDPVNLTIKGFSHVENDTTTISNNEILFICQDPNDPESYLWVGTEGGGLNKFEKKNGRCISITANNGLPNNVIYTIFPDKEGKLWMSTNKGLCTLDPRAMTFKYFDIYDGLQGMEFNRIRNYQTPNGRIYLEGTEGVNVFYPEEILDNKNIPNVVFTDLKIRGKSIGWNDRNSPINECISEAKMVTLPYDENFMTFEFSALDFSN
jgi:ligand-binding sensor domain-containing protein